MRFISVTELEVGMICGKNLYDVNNRLLLRRGSTVQRRYKDRIIKLGYQGIYIDDRVSEDLVIEDIISDDLRIECIKTIKDIYMYTQNPKKYKGSFDSRIKKLEELVVVVVDQIYEKPKTMINLIDLKFYMDYTYFHVVNVAVLAILLADEYGLKRQEMIYIGMASLLQDIGEMFIDSKILNKDGKLSKEEFDEIKKHPVSGYKYLKESYKIHTAVYTAVLHHHEKYDGTGYPSGIGKEKISILARIISVAEIYDALTSKRSFRNPLLPSEAMEYIMANGGVIFDLVVTKIFARKVAPFPIGTYVDLSNDISGIVVTNYEDACLRPLVRILVNNLGESVEPYLLNLRDDKKLRSVIIVGVNNIEIQKL